MRKAAAVTVDRVTPAFAKPARRSAAVPRRFAVLQRAVGNQAVLRIAARTSEDEQQADAVARDAEHGIQRTGTAARPQLTQPSAPSPFAAGSGAPIAAAVRHRLEPFVGRDIGAVRVHEDERSRHTASAIGARAFTVGNHVHLARGSSPSDLGLIAHEATHTGQAATPGGVLLRRQATAASITPSYVAALDDGDLLFEMDVAESALRGARSSDEAFPVLSANVRVLRDEYLRRSPTTRPEIEAPVVASEAPRLADIPEGGTAVGRMGVVSWDGQPPLRLRTTPDASTPSNITTELKFSERVLVIKMYPGDWFLVSTSSGDMGFAYSKHIAMDLPEPNARLHRVEPGVQGTAIAIAQRYYHQYARDWGQDLRFYVNVLAWANSVSVPNETAGWRRVQFQAGQLIWIPSQSFAYGLRGGVNSGSATFNAADAIGVATFIERVAQLLADFDKALNYALKFRWEAIANRVEQSALGLVQGLVVMLGIAVGILAITTGIGAFLGGVLGFGAGAAPGAAAGFEVGIVLLNWLGLAMLVYWIGESLVQVGKAFASFLGTVWDARGDEKKLEFAGWQWADAIALLIAKILEALLMYVMARGLPKGLDALKGTRFGKALGETAAARWLAERTKSVSEGNSKLKSPEAVWNQIRGRTVADVATVTTRGRPAAFHQLPADRLPSNLPAGHFWRRSADGTQWVLMREGGAAPAPFELTVYADAAGNVNYVLRSGDRVIQADAITRATTYNSGQRLPASLSDTGATNPYRDPVTNQPWDKGHLVDYADTLEGPGVLSSTTDPANFVPQASWWNQGPRNALVSRIRTASGGYREMAIYDPTPPVTANGTPIPREFIFVETNPAGVVQNAWRIPNQQGAAGRALASINPMRIPNSSVPPVMLRTGPLAGPGGGAFYAPGIVFGVRGAREDSDPRDNPASKSSAQPVGAP